MSSSMLHQGAVQRLTSLLEAHLCVTEEQAVIVLWEDGCALAAAVLDAYREALPEATFLNFHTTAGSAILAGFDLLRRGDAVVLVQSGSFAAALASARPELESRGIRVVDHAELERLQGPDPEACLRSLCPGGGVAPALADGSPCPGAEVLDAVRHALAQGSPGPQA